MQPNSSADILDILLRYPICERCSIIMEYFIFEREKKHEKNFSVYTSPLKTVRKKLRKKIY